MSEISNRPYFLRAMYEWIVDNGWTPHLQVDANWPGIQIPFEYAEDGVIILNISPSAVLGLRMENDWIRFRARFKGVEQELGFPPEAVLAIFARENGQGMPFPPEYYPEEAEEQPKASVEKKPTLSTVEGKLAKTEEAAGAEPKTDKKPKKRGHLSVVK